MAVTIQDIRVICTAPEGLIWSWLRSKPVNPDCTVWGVRPLLTAIWQ